MFRNNGLRGRRAAQLLVVIGLAGLVWLVFGPGLPVIRGPRADTARIASGRELFEHEWRVNDALAGGDGLGPLFNDTSCAACHNLGGLGGAGGREHNVQGFEVVLNSVFPEQIMSGQVHAFSVNPESLETTGMVHAKHPNRTIRLPKLNSTALFGAGWIDRMSEMSIRNNHRRATAKSVASEFGGDFTNVMPGRLRVLADGRIGRFGWKAQFATLREFVAAASANELGLSSSIAPLATPLGDVPVSAGANIAPDLDERKLSSLVGFVDTLPRPVELTPPNSADMALVEQGRKMFVSIGCAGCHTPDLGGVKGVYSDLALHEIEDPPPSSSYFSPLNVPRGPRDDPQADEWRTPPLWGVADSAPYLHDGSAATLHDAILRHRGSTRHVTERYVKFAERPILAFLNTLKAPPNATPVKSTNVDSVRVVSR